MFVLFVSFSTWKTSSTSCRSHWTIAGESWDPLAFAGEDRCAFLAAELYGMPWKATKISLVCCRAIAREQRLAKEGRL